MGATTDPGDASKVRPCIHTCRINKQLSDELRNHYLPPRRNQAWLFTDLLHKNVTHSQPLLYKQGRESGFMKSLDRFLATTSLKCTVKAVQDAAVAERQQRRQCQEEENGNKALLMS